MSPDQSQSQVKIKFLLFYIDFFNFISSKIIKITLSAIPFESSAEL